MTRENNQRTTPTDLKSCPTGSSESQDSDDPRALSRSRDATSLTIQNTEQAPANQEPVPPDIEPGSIEYSIRLSHPVEQRRDYKKSSKKATDNTLSSKSQKASNFDGPRSLMGQWSLSSSKARPAGTPQKALLYSPVVTPSGTRKPSKPWEAGNWRLQSKNVTASTPLLPTPMKLEPWKVENWRSGSNDVTTSTPLLPTPTTLEPWKVENWRSGSNDVTASTSLLPTPTTPAAPTTSPPYDVIRYTPAPGNIDRIENKYPESIQKSNIPEDLVSGDIITMCAALQHHGFNKADENRWFLVLGKKRVGTGYVIAPLATFGGRGKNALAYWKAEYFKPLQKKSDHDDTPNYDEGYSDDDMPDYDEGYSDDDMPDYDEGYNDHDMLDYDDTQFYDKGYSDDDTLGHRKLDPKSPVFSKGHLCRSGSVVPLTTAFVVKPDHSGHIPAKFEGFLTPESFDDVWECMLHLMKYHPEAHYLFQNNLHDWDIGVAKRYPKCRMKGCHLGEFLKSI